MALLQEYKQALSQSVNARREDVTVLRALAQLVERAAAAEQAQAAIDAQMYSTGLQ